jgi:hypothetical protein
MNRVWKWVLGIVLVLILCAAVGGTMFAFGHRYAASVAPLGQANQAGNYAWGMPMHRDFDGPSTPYHQREFGPGMYPHMGIWGGRGMMPFGGGCMLFGGLIRLFIPLLVLGLVAFAAYQFGKRAVTQPAAAPAAVPPPPPAPAAPKVGENEGEEPPQ